MNLKLEKGSVYKLHKNFLSDYETSINATYLGKAEIHRGKTPYVATKDDGYCYYHIFLDQEGCYHLATWEIQYDQVYLNIVKSGNNVSFLLYNFNQTFVTISGGEPLNKYLDCSYDKQKESF